RSVWGPTAGGTDGAQRRVATTGWSKGEGMTLAPERPGTPLAGRPGTENGQGTSALASPSRAEGVELIGEYEGSGFKEAPSLVRRADGQVIQLPPLLYKVAAKADGRRTYQQIAVELSAEIKRGLDADNVRFLVEEKLFPLGIV